MQQRMIDRVRKSQLSAQMMQAAARGALAVDSKEMMEILVHLALHSKLFGEQASITLAGWDEKASVGVASDPATSQEVLGYLISPKNLRPALLPALFQNPSVDRQALLEVASTGARWVVEALLTNEVVRKSPALLSALESNPRLRSTELVELGAPAAATGVPSAASHAPPVETPAQIHSVSAAVTSGALAETDSEPHDEEVVTQAITSFLQQNEAELAAVADKPFELVVVHEGTGLEGGTAPPPVASPVVEAQPAAASASAPAPTPRAKPGPPAAAESRRDSTLQKISRLDIKGRIALAMRGTKEERSILIRDSTKLVALAVLDSPKVSEGEVEKFALQKNVLEAVLRAIPMRRRFMKNYSIVRNLVTNPRTPMDLGLGLMKNLLVSDLRNLSANKEVSDTIRKLALRMYKQKIEKGGKD